MASRTRTDKTATTTTVASAASQSGRQGDGYGSSSIAPSAEALDSVRCECLMNSRYHSAREAFLDSVHRWLMLAVIVFGAGAVLALLPEKSVWPSIFSASAAAMAALDLTFDLSNRARTHALMKRRYFELLADMRAGIKTVDEAEACLHRYSADEEPAYHALLASSWNAAQEMLYGDNAGAYEIPYFDRKLQNFWRREGKKYPMQERRQLAV